MKRVHLENGTGRLLDCPNEYTKVTIFDYFMEREEDIETCKNCSHLCYVTGTISCELLNQLLND